METAVFLQVRLDSQRLPEKALAELHGLPLIVRCAQALNAVPADLRVIVTEPDSAEKLQHWVKFCGWEMFIGSKLDVLDRFVQAALSFDVELIVRATGDNPLVNAPAATQILARHLATGASYSAWQGAPVGTGVEILKTAALVQALAGDPDSYEREHVAPFLYRRPEVFRLNRPEVPATWKSSQSVTVDTGQDLAYVQHIFEAFDGLPPTDLEELASWLNHHPR